MEEILAQVKYTVRQGLGTAISTQLRSQFLGGRQGGNLQASPTRSPNPDAKPFPTPNPHPKPSPTSKRNSNPKPNPNPTPNPNPNQARMWQMREINFDSHMISTPDWLWEVHPPALVRVRVWDS